MTAGGDRKRPYLLSTYRQSQLVKHYRLAGYQRPRLLHRRQCGVMVIQYSFRVIFRRALLLLTDAPSWA